MNEQSPSTIRVMPVHDTTRIVNWVCTCQSMGHFTVPEKKTSLLQVEFSDETSQTNSHVTEQ
jgi:hypothetical protein